MSTHPKIHPGIHTYIHYAYINHLSSIIRPCIPYPSSIPAPTGSPPSIYLPIPYFSLHLTHLPDSQLKVSESRTESDQGTLTVRTAFRNLWMVHRAKTTRVCLELTHLQASPTTQTRAIDEETRRGCTDLQTVQWEELNATCVDGLPVYFYDSKHWISQKTSILTTRVRESQAMGTNTLNSGTKSWHTKVIRIPDAKPLDPRFSDRDTACPVSLQLIQMDRLTHTTSKQSWSD